MKRKKGFTLIELLVVISIIALLVSILMPALNKAREQATGAVCLNNVRSLNTAWQMYASEHDDRIPKGGPWHGTSSMGMSRTKYNWVISPMEDPGETGDPGNYRVLNLGSNPNDESWIITKKDRQRGIEKGALWPYLENYEVYNCPGDKRWRTEDTPMDVYVTYSMQHNMFGEPGWVADKSPYTKLGQIRRPSSVFNFFEEITLNTGYNWGTGGPQMNSTDIGDIEWIGESYGTWHNNSCAFGFCDGHAEMYKWQDPRTLEYFADFLATKGFPNVSPVQPDNPDLLWMQQHYGGRPYDASYWDTQFFVNDGAYPLGGSPPTQ